MAYKSKYLYQYLMRNLIRYFQIPDSCAEVPYKVPELPFFWYQIFVPKYLIRFRNGPFLVPDFCAEVPYKVPE